MPLTTPKTRRPTPIEIAITSRRSVVAMADALRNHVAALSRGKCRASYAARSRTRKWGRFAESACEGRACCLVRAGETRELATSDRAMRPFVHRGAARRKGALCDGEWPYRRARRGRTPTRGRLGFEGGAHGLVTRARAGHADPGHHR